MSTSRAFLRRIGWGASSLVAAAVMVGSSTATADIVSFPGVTVTAPAGGFVVGTPVDVTGFVVYTAVPFLSNMQVTFTDNGSCFYSMYPLNLNGDYVHATWVPTTAGTHTITVTQGGSDSKTVTVAAAPAGTKVPTPSTPGCGGSGSAGSGSAGTGSLGF